MKALLAWLFLAAAVAAVLVPARRAAGPRRAAHADRLPDVPRPQAPPLLARGSGKRGRPLATCRIPRGTGTLRARTPPDALNPLDPDILDSPLVPSEFGYPGTPEDSIACVTHASSSHLYRRYGPAGYSLCPGLVMCCGGYLEEHPDLTTAASCADACNCNNNCKYMLFKSVEPTGCVFYGAACTSYDNVSYSSFDMYAKAGNACPGTYQSCNSD
ncbi:hypothetical protein DFJ74DRAFT_640007 [Hyaloraphidium curvatum]|nr:hypothetical protein DFJ74DRAFT_640007 [Hyaloraphidium curvatum]